MDSFSQELGVFISEYLGFFSEKEKIAGVCIIGSGSSVKGLGAFLESRFAISYVCVDPLSVTDKIEIGADISDNYKTEMGLIPAALDRSSKRYNLTSPYYRIIKETHKAKIQSMFIWLG